MVMGPIGVDNGLNGDIQIDVRRISWRWYTYRVCWRKDDRGNVVAGCGSLKYVKQNVERAVKAIPSG